ncbi:MAG: hypothetical protein ABSB74_08430 [Tepidisphaeraceae bacterium]
MSGAKATKKHYDFSKAVQGKLCRPAKTLQVPIYLDDDVRGKLLGKDKRAAANLTKIVNAILRSQIGVLEMPK